MMDNFQLYKTSPLLGGQMKIDLVLEDSFGELYVDDFHITPISPNVPYNKYSLDSLKNYSHQSNVKDFYKEIESSFYEDFVNPELVHEWPISSNVQNYDDTFMTGCKRSLYNIYNKQFEFLVPLWLEKVDGDIEFIIKLFGTKMVDGKISRSSENPVSSKTLTIKKEDNGFGDYIYNYFKYVGVDGGGSNKVINVDLMHKYACVTGLEVSTGNVATKDVSNVVENILYRERPLIEFNSMLTNLFKDNNLIAKQLFNFCLCFNPDDLFTSSLSEMLMGNTFQISIDVKVGGKLLEKKDIYTNFEYIEKSVYNNYWWYDGINKPEFKSISSDLNVLDYLQDNKCVDLIYANKIVQKIPHWQIADNPDYIFNVYGGFSGVHRDGDGVVYGAHTNGITPNLEVKEYHKELNNIGWANVVDGLNIDGFIRLSNGFEDESNIFKKMDKWLNNIQYSDPKPDYYIVLASSNNTYGFDDFMDSLTYKHDTNIFKCKDSNLIFSHHNKHIMLYGKTKDDITFANVREVVKSVGENNNDDTPYGILKKYINSVVEQPIVSFNRSLSILKTGSPSLSSKEIEYYKNNNSHSYVLRYDGDIKPCFISEPKNYFYSKKMYKCDEKGCRIDNYNTNFNNSKYPPCYPSIDFYSLITHKTYDDALNSIYTYDEYKWFNSSSIIFLKPSISFGVVLNVDDDINDIVEENIKNIYNKFDSIEYIKSKYNIDYNLISTDVKESEITNSYIIEMNLK